MQHTARRVSSPLSRAGQGVNALQFGGAGFADFTLHATIYVTLRSNEERAMTSRDIETVCSIALASFAFYNLHIYLLIKANHNKTKYFRLRLSDEFVTERHETDLSLT